MKRQDVLHNPLRGYLLGILLTLFSILLALELVLSLDWSMAHDTPLLHYAAFLIDKHGFVPYRDIFETSFPGTFLFHLSIGKLFGYGDRAFRTVDIGYLLVLFGITWGFMRHFGRRVAWAGILVFGLTYLGYGPKMSLQRDFIGILPIAGAILVAISGIVPARPAVKSFLVGLLFGLAVSVKPHLGVGLPFVVGYLVLDASGGVQRRKGATVVTSIRLGLLAVAGLLAAVAVPFIWLWAQGGLPYFWDMFSNYMPLYLQLTGNAQILSTVDHWIYLVQSYQLLGQMSYLLIPASLGLYLVLFEGGLPRKRVLLAGLLGCLAFVYSVYPAISGQFWSYHWMPFDYFAILCSSLALIVLPAGSVSSVKRVFPILVVVFFLFLSARPAPDFFLQVRGLPPAPPENGRVDAIANFLKSHLNPGDKVQPLASAGGIVQGMLRSEAVIATPYMEDYTFYHHVSDPYIQLLRQDFIGRMQEQKPRFIIELLKKPDLSGPDTSTEFPELRSFIQDNYVVLQETRGYTIFELKR
jgi:hypothetical protein